MRLQTFTQHRNAPRGTLMKNALRAAALFCLLALAAPAALEAGVPAGKLRVSGDGRFFVSEAGEPFFWQGDTAWELFTRLNRAEVIAYLDDRAARRFNVIQAAAISCFVGAGKNAQGDRPCDGTIERISTTPGNDPQDAEQYDYWDHVEFIIDAAAERGLQVSVTAVWQNQTVLEGAERPVNSANAEGFGRFLGERFGRKPNVLWQVVGDADVTRQTDPKWREVWRSLARGLTRATAGGNGDGVPPLISFHPAGPGVSATHFADEPWITFHTAQSGHNKDQEHPHALIAAGRRAEPVKPVIDYEPPYDDLLRADQTEHGRNDAADARKSAYWSVFAGALGVSYGHAALFQMWRPGIKAWDGARIDWRAALASPAGDDMRHLRALIESRPQLSRTPAQGLLYEPGAGAAHLRALRGDGYALIYSPEGNPFRVHAPKLGWTTETVAWWFDPREGVALEAVRFTPDAPRDFTPPSRGRGNDWVLVLDDASRRDFSPPGTLTAKPLP